MKKKHILILILCFSLILSLNAWKIRDFKTFKTEIIKKEVSFKNLSKSNNFEINNVFGHIHLSGYKGKTVIVSAVKTIKALNQTEAGRAEREVVLNIFNDQDGIRFYVDGPFRDKNRHRKRDWKKTTYIVLYDFEVKVPRNLNIRLKTITKGDIRVSNIKGKCILNNVNDIITAENISGDFNIKTVNGKIDINQVTGSGNAHTINGAVTVIFAKNPHNACSFNTINGDLNIYFKKGLSADFQLKTIHGKIYSDFPSTYLPSKSEKKQNKGLKFIYSRNSHQSIRIGNRGPTIKLDTINGNMYINKGEKL
jgi:DUF4097 and DUF4098 domain-containing protein YvlB